MDGTSGNVGFVVYGKNMKSCVLVVDGLSVVIVVHAELKNMGEGFSHGCSDNPFCAVVRATIDDRKPLGVLYVGQGH